MIYSIFQLPSSKRKNLLIRRIFFKEEKFLKRIVPSNKVLRIMLFRYLRQEMMQVREKQKAEQVETLKRSMQGGMVSFAPSILQCSTIFLLTEARTMPSHVHCFI